MICLSRTFRVITQRDEIRVNWVRKTVKGSDQRYLLLGLNVEEKDSVYFQFSIRGDG